ASWYDHSARRCVQYRLPRTRAPTPSPSAQPAAGGLMSGSAVRQARLRSRRKRSPDLRVFGIEAYEQDLARALIAAGRLSPQATLRRQLVEAELAGLVQDFIERWRASDRWPE